MGLKAHTINKIIDVEGGYVDDPNDSGGETNYGITVKVARENNYSGDMRDLPRDLAFDIYSRKYWDSLNGDNLVFSSPKIAAEVIDTGVNVGTERAAMFLQRALNVLNRSEKLYDDIAVDGSIGNKTLIALANYLKERDESTLNTALNCLQGAFYISLAERREKDERFVYGWLKERVVL